MRNLPPEAVGAELGSPYYIAPWALETLVNELLATPKPPGFGVGRTRAMDPRTFGTLRVLNNLLVKLENAEDGIFLQKHDVFYEMARIAQRQFPLATRRLQRAASLPLHPALRHRQRW